MMRDSVAIWAQVRQRLAAFVGKRVTPGTDADDILQQVFLRMHEQMYRVKDPARVVPWLYQIARNAIADYYRSPERNRMIPVSEAEKVYPSASSFLPDNEEPAKAREELASCLRPMLERLSSDYRDAVILVELEGLTQKAAAKCLGISLSGMKSRVQRGRKQLKQLLDECCLIQLDRRGGVTDYESRKAGCEPCKSIPRQLEAK